MNQAPVPPPHVVVITHGDLGRALVQAVEMIAGPQPGIAWVALPPSETPASLEARLASAWPAGQPALLLVDMAGGTPWNTALRVARRRPAVRVVGGVNLPMLLEVALTLSQDNLDGLARAAEQAGALSIHTAAIHPDPGTAAQP